jgi:hypothetical protein
MRGPPRRPNLGAIRLWARSVSDSETICAQIVVAIVLLAGCASDEGEPTAATKPPAASTTASAPAADAAPTDPAATERPATQPPESEAPVTDPPVTEVTVTEETAEAQAELAPGEWIHEFDEPDGTSLSPPFEEASAEQGGLIARDGVAVPSTLDIAAYLRGQPADPTNCFAEVTFNLAQGGNYGPVINHNGPAGGAEGRVRSGYFLGWYQGDEAIRLYAAERPDPLATYNYGSRPDRDVTLRIERRGDDLEVFVDGESVMTAKASDEPSASEGTWVGMFYRGTDTADQIGYFTRFAGGSL